MATRALPLTPNPQGFSARSLPAVDWRRVARLLHASRALDDIEESRLVPEKKVLYQFSARGHELGQLLLGLRLTAKHDGVGVYYWIDDQCGYALSGSLDRAQLLAIGRLVYAQLATPEPPR